MVNTPRNIVVLSDGTGNSAGKLSRTNVWRVYETLDLADPAKPMIPRQFAFYDNGVGTSSFKPLAVLGGAFGWGLARNVQDLYTFICRTYRPGDRIYAFGFSRGAFTIRVLVAMLMSQGLVSYNGNEAELSRLSKAAYREWRKNRPKKYPIADRVTAPLLRGLRDAVINTWEYIRDKKPYRDIERVGTPNSPDPLHIHFVGLWDTVDAYGLPIDELTRGIDMFIWPLTMRNAKLEGRVDRAMHALSLDDERNTFHPRLWTEVSDDGTFDVGVPDGNPVPDNVGDERISQVWFAGVHSNVGGGYPDDGLAYVSLKWIMDEAERHKLRFCPTLVERLWELQDENGPIYDSRKGLAGYYRYNPRRIESLAERDGVKLSRVKIHESVLRRIQVGQDGYAPFVLPPGFAVARINGQIVDGAEYLSGKYEETPYSLTNQKVDLSPNSPYRVQREHVWNWVWRRRVVYFVTLFATVLIAAAPMYLRNSGACESQLCFVPAGLEYVTGFLPSWAATWINTFNTHPIYFTVLASVVAIGLRRGGQLERGIRDQMRRIWYQFDKLRPNSAKRYAKPEKPSRFHRFVQRLRLHPGYQTALRALTHGFFPIVFVLSLLYVGAAAVFHAIFAMGSSAGYVCKSTPDHPPNPVGSRAEGLTFKTNEPCASTRLMLEQGVKYRIFISIPEQARWTDDGLPAGPNGLDPGAAPWYMKLAVPLRRHWHLPWYAPIARIGTTGTDEYELKPEPPIATERRKPGDGGETCDAVPPLFPERSARDLTYTAEIMARSSGELFVYVNDAVVPPIVPPRFRVKELYCNNAGIGRITVERLVPPPLRP